MTDDNNRAESKNAPADASHSVYSRLAEYRKAQAEVEAAQAEVDKLGAEYGAKYSGRAGGARLQRERAQAAKSAPAPGLPDYRFKGGEQAARQSKKTNEELVELYRLQVELQEKIFNNSLKTMTATERQAALNKEIARHEANAAFYASVGDLEMDVKSGKEKFKAEGLRGELATVEKKDQQIGHGQKFGLNAQQHIGAYSAASGGDKALHVLEKIHGCVEYLKPPAHPAVGKENSRFGGIYQ